VNEYFSAIAIGIALLSFLASHFGSIPQLRERLTAVETRLDLFWKLMEKSMASIIRSPHTPRLDELLDKLLEDKSLNLAEAEELRWLLKEKDEFDDDKKILAKAMLLPLVEQKIYDLKKRGSNG
jgi:hypothetical protein